jgi:3-hydroxymyristoyl/3-hydroxydecanoyl-(acyl carrier protein) dehydratase
VSFRGEDVAAAAAIDTAARPQSLGNTANSALETDMLRRAAIETFLGVQLPDDEDLFGTEEPRFLKLSDIEELMLERAPFFFIERAVAIGNHTVLGLARITIERSAGHFPTKPIVPLIELCKAMAQTGIILASLHAQPHEAPIAIGAGASKALAKELVTAPVDVLIKVTLQGARLKLYFVDGCAFVDGGKIGTLDKIIYTLLPREQLTG